uniref:Uncharacterized protein n=1 Tax=Babesia bovis TaxID=5865 RepID=S6BK92_BABBO|nr:hypothetical protein [Babesia bovis]
MPLYDHYLVSPEKSMTSRWMTYNDFAPNNSLSDGVVRPMSPFTNSLMYVPVFHDDKSERDDSPACVLIVK